MLRRQFGTVCLLKSQTLSHNLKSVFPTIDALFYLFPSLIVAMRRHVDGIGCFTNCVLLFMLFLQILVCITFFLIFILTTIWSFDVLCCHLMFLMWRYHFNLHASVLHTYVLILRRPCLTLMTHAHETASFLLYVLLCFQRVLKPVIAPCDFTKRHLISVLQLLFLVTRLLYSLFASIYTGEFLVTWCWHSNHYCDIYPICSWQRLVTWTSLSHMYRCWTCRI